MASRLLPRGGMAGGVQGSVFGLGGGDDDVLDANGSLVGEIGALGAEGAGGGPAAGGIAWVGGTTGGDDVVAVKGSTSSGRVDEVNCDWIG